MWLRLPIVLLTLTVLACSGPDADLPSTVAVRDSAGVQLVHNGSAAIDTLSVRVEEVLRIGELEGREELQFHFIRGVAVDAHGRVFVADDGTRAIRVYGPDGHFQKRFGGPGDGPGEFRRIVQIALWRDTLHVLDAGRFTGTFFDTTGALLQTYPTLKPDRSQLNLFTGTPFGWFAARERFLSGPPTKLGDVYTMRHRRGIIDPARMVGAALSVEGIQQIVWGPGVSDSGRGPAAADSAFASVLDYPGARTFVMLGSEGGSERALLGNPPYFEPNASIAHDTLGHTYALPGWPYRIDVFDHTGRHVRRISRAHDSIPVTDAMVDEILRRAQTYHDTASERGGASMHTYNSRARFPRVGYVPVTGTVRVSADGWIWVLRRDINVDPVTLEWSDRDAPARPSYWDVFNPDGHWQYTVRLPERFGLRIVLPNEVIGIQRDEYDVQYVVRYRLVRSADQRAAR